jgi:peptide/nickel transport system permease protein
MSDAALVADRIVPREPGRLERWGAVLRANKLESVGILLALVAVFLVIFGPYLAPHDPYRVDFTASLKPPSWSHPFGTDEAGRDVLSRVLYGARLTLLSVAAVILFATVVGVIVGTFAALAGGFVDEVLMRTADIGLSFPALILALGLAAALGASLRAAIVALAVTWWPGYARLVRSLVLETRHREFVDGARALGVSRTRLVLRHILPNSLDTLFVQTTLDVAAVTLVISGLSFIGVGAQIPQAEWGAMIADGRTQITSAWWTVLYPGLAIALTAIGFNLVGDLLRSELDPTLRTRDVH